MFSLIAIISSSTDHMLKSTCKYRLRSFCYQTKSEFWRFTSNLNKHDKFCTNFRKVQKIGHRVNSPNWASFWSLQRDGLDCHWTSNLTFGSKVHEIGLLSNKLSELGQSWRIALSLDCTKMVSFYEFNETDTTQILIKFQIVICRRNRENLVPTSNYDMTKCNGLSKPLYR